MARARNIKPSFFINEDLVELPFETRLLFIGLWTLCDRQGYLEDKPKRIKMALFPADDVNIDQMLNNLEQNSFLIRYVANNRKCIFLPKFVKHQNPHHKESINDVPRYSTNQDQGKPEANLGQEQDHSNVTISASENQEYINDLNSITYSEDNQSPSQALVKPESSRADILIPDSFNLNPESLNLIDETEDSRFNISLSDVNTRLSMVGLKNISEQDLNVLLIQLRDAYSHKKQMVKNQILGKAFEWIKRQQETPLHVSKKNSFQTSAQKTEAEMDKWKNFTQSSNYRNEPIDITPKQQVFIEG